MSDVAPLSEVFLDWWFAPWRLPAGPRLGPSLGAPWDGPGPGPLARGQAYRGWCHGAGVPADFPPCFDSAWQFAALDDPAPLRRAARLFAGLLAARLGDQRRLGQLPLAERRWCMSVALAQPVSGLMAPDACAFDSLETQGLLELACALESGFPGMWSRLRLMLPEAQAARVEDGLRHGRSDVVPTGARAARGQRCWRLCIARAPAALPGGASDTGAAAAALADAPVSDDDLQSDEVMA